ncbi:MAG: pyridoxamine 5'-phosphate oxidase family protein [Pseudomonadota bacterium]
MWEGPSPYHEGELAVQELLGVRERVDGTGRRMIRPILIDQHREFYGELPFLVLGSVDVEGRPWASIVTGSPGFLSTPYEGTLDIAAVPVEGDPLAENLALEADIGVLGIQLETRRRNRMSGRVKALKDDGFALDVLQSFGNCPQYIQTRTVALDDAAMPIVRSGDRFDDTVQSVLTRSDTLFIASTYRANAEDVTHGTDVSHRGGKPGFVKIDDNRTLTIPDFRGNNAFNTIGNLHVNPKAGFLFPDFQTRTMVTMTGKAEMIWDGPEVDAFEGAQRLIRFRADLVHTIEDGLPLTTEFGEYSRQLERTGEWSA